MIRSLAYGKKAFRVSFRSRLNLGMYREAIGTISFRDFLFPLVSAASHFFLSRMCCDDC